MKVLFTPQNIECEIKPGQSVLHVAQDNGIYVKSVCRGVPNCAECRVRVTAGDFNVLPPGAAELALIGTAHFVDRRRLSCQLKCFGDITVDLTEQVEKEKKALAKNTRSRAGADELAISRASVSSEGGEAGDGADGVALAGDSSHEGGAPTLAHDASADELRASGDGLGPDDHGGDDLEGEREARPPARGQGRDQNRDQTRPQSRPQIRPPQQGGGRPPQGAQAPGGEPGGGGKKRRRRGRRGGGGGKNGGGGPPS